MTKRTTVSFVFVLLLLTVRVACAQEEEPAPGEQGPSAESEDADAVEYLEGTSAEEPSHEEGPPAEDPSIHRSYLHFMAGMELVESEHWEAAVAEFEESLRLHHNSSALLNRALCFQRLRRYQESIGSFLEYLDHYGDEISPQRRTEVQQNVTDIRALVTEVRLDITPVGATIVVQGRTVGTSPLEAPLLLASGQHRLEVRLEGHETHRADIMVVRNRPRRLRIELTEEPDTGLLRIDAEPAFAQLSIDDQDVGTPPYEGHLRPGVHIVTVSAGGYRTETRTVGIEEGAEREVTVTLQRVRLPQSWFWTVLGVTAVGVLTTTALGIAALALDAEYDPLAPEDYDVYHRGQRIMLATDISLGLTSATLVASLVIGLLTDWDLPTDRQD